MAVSKALLTARRRLIKSASRNLELAAAADNPTTRARYEMLAAIDTEYAQQTYERAGAANVRRSLSSQLTQTLSKKLGVSTANLKTRALEALGAQRGDDLATRIAKRLGADTTPLTQRLADKLGADTTPLKQRLAGPRGEDLAARIVNSINNALNTRPSTGSLTDRAIIDRSKLTLQTGSLDERRSNMARTILNNSVTGPRIMGGLVDIWRDQARVTDDNGFVNYDQAKIIPAILEHFGVDNMADVIEILEREIGPQLYAADTDGRKYELIKLLIQSKVAEGVL